MCLRPPGVASSSRIADGPEFAPGAGDHCKEADSLSMWPAQGATSRRLLPVQRWPGDRCGRPGWRGAAAGFAKAKTWLSICAMGQQTHGIRDGDPIERYEFEFGVPLTDIIYMGVTESYV